MASCLFKLIYCSTVSDICFFFVTGQSALRRFFHLRKVGKLQKSWAFHTMKLVWLPSVVSRRFLIMPSDQHSSPADIYNFGSHIYEVSVNLYHRLLFFLHGLLHPLLLFQIPQHKVRIILGTFWRRHLVPMWCWWSKKGFVSMPTASTSPLLPPNSVTFSSWKMETHLPKPGTPFYVPLALTLVRLQEKLREVE